MIRKKVIELFIIQLMIFFDIKNKKYLIKTN
jgi:hypothetical protein